MSRRVKLALACAPLGFAACGLAYWEVFRLVMRGIC